MGLKQLDVFKTKKGYVVRARYTHGDTQSPPTSKRHAYQLIKDVRGKTRTRKVF